MSARVLFYVQHLLGVGHVMRAASIARALIDQGVEVCVALGGEPVSFAEFGGARVQELPSARAADKTFKVILDEAGNPIDDAWRANRRRLLLSLAAEVRPDALLVEHFPFGRQKFAFELVPLFELVKGRQDAAILCSVRDVLTEIGKPHVRQMIVDMAQRWYDRILVHGDPSVIKFETTFSEAALFADLITYTGYVVDDRALDPGEPGADGHDEVIVSVGGGAVGDRLLTSALDAAEAGALSSRRWRLLAGHNLPEAIFQQLRARASDQVRVERARPDFRALLARCALSISQGGYNTMMNVLTSGRPGLIVPFDAPGEGEQLLRAREFERRGLMAVLEEHELTPDTLTSAAEATLPLIPPGTLAIDLAGAERTAEIVAQFARREVASLS